MKPRREDAEALAEAADDEIAAAVAPDPDAAPILREGELDAFLAREAERDLYGVARLRRQLKMAQVVFADRFGIPLTTLRNWEQGRCEPDQAARVLLAVIEADPQLVAWVVTERRRGTALPRQAVSIPTPANS